MDYENIDVLRASGAKPHWFGLGFIQLKLDQSTRMHFWHPELSADVPEEEIHDHRYFFESRLLRGTLTNTLYAFDEAEGDEGGPDEMVTVSCQPGSNVAPKQVATGHIRQTGYMILTAGSTYTMQALDFHRIETKNAVTLLRRGSIRATMARVIRPIGTPDVCPFAREIPETKLWDYMADSLGSLPSPGYHVTPIQKGVLGEPSKIREELDELEDALRQGVNIMALIEASDLYGALESFVETRFPKLSMQDLAAMSAVTKRAFLSGRRT